MPERNKGTKKLDYKGYNQTLPGEKTERMSWIDDDFT
jgi:hypothetical protein